MRHICLRTGLFWPQRSQGLLRPVAHTERIKINIKWFRVNVMMTFLMDAAQNPATPILVLFGVGVVIIVEAWKVSHKALMGDLFAEGYDE